jgi:predicted dehydrogenase
MSDQPIRLIQVGMGGWGRDWATKVVPRAADFERVAWVDVEQSILVQLQDELNVPPSACFSSLEAALDVVDAEAVLITAALPGHVPVAMAALRAGKHVLVEKPFAPSVAEAQGVVGAAEAAGRVVMVSQNYRHYPAVRAVSALIKQQVLGPVDTVDVQFRKYANSTPVEGHRHYAIRHPLLLDMSIHHFDLMRCVLNQEPTHVMCHAWNPPWSNVRDPAAASATIEFDSGAVVSYKGSWVSTAPDTTWAGSWRIECQHGEIAWSSRDDFTLKGDAVIVRPRGKRARRVELPQIQHWDRAGTLAAFAHAIRTGEEPETSGCENLGTLALTFAMINAAETQQPQMITARQTQSS